MPITPLRNPPADASGGIIVIRAKTAEQIVHTMRFHVCNFNAGDLTYNPSTAQGTTTEAGVTDTANALIPLLHPYWTSAWDLRWTALWHNQGGGVLKRVHVPNPLHHAGTSVGTFAGVQYVLRQILQFSTTADGRARLVLEGVAGGAVATDDYVTATTGGAAVDNALVGYLTGTATAVRGHDGQPLAIPAHLTHTVSMRDRRKGLRSA